MRRLCLNLANKYLIFIPILLYIGERSYIAQDEGYYALQARWMIEKGNWIAPHWWNDVVFDRTIGVQWLIALTQKFVGINIFSAHIPSIISSIITLILTYELSKELIGKKYPWLSPIILAGTYLWVNNAHLATQDMPLLASEMIGLWSLITLEKNKAIKLLLIGISLGIALMLKSIMLVVPIIAITPYCIVYRKYIFKEKYFWIGTTVGLIPFITWISIAFSNYGFEKVSLLVNKINHLSTSAEFSKSYFYYIWNIPANTFPWGLISLIGIFIIIKSNDKKRILILFIYPLLFLIQLTIFKTKTPYYPLQLTPFIAINSSLALQVMVNSNKNIVNLYKKVISFAGLLIALISFYLINSKAYIDNTYFNSWISYSLFILGLSWALIIINHKHSRILSLSVFGPFLALCLVVQSGLLTNRDPYIRQIFRNYDLAHILESNKINFVIPSNLNNNEFTSLVKIALYTPIIGESMKEKDMNTLKGYTWLREKSIVNLPNKENYSIIVSNTRLYPWILVEGNL